MEIEHFAGLIVLGGLSLLMVLPAALLLPISVISSFHLVKTAGEAWGGVALALPVPIALLAAVYFVMRALIIPPRWRAWVRMARFAQDNRITFMIEDPGQIPGTLVPKRPYVASRLYGVFRDDARKLTVGDYVVPTTTGRGLATWCGVILLETGLPLEEGRLGLDQISALIGTTAEGWQVDMEVTGDVLVAVKQFPFFTRRTASLQRAFAIAIAMHSNSRTLLRR